MKTPSFISHKENDFDEICRKFKWNVPEYINLGYDCCDKHADEPSKVAVFFEDEKGQAQKVTFRELITWSNQFANTLKGLGVDAGDRVCVILPQMTETVVAHLGIYKLGGVALPLSVLFQKDALQYRLLNSETKVVVVGEQDAPKVRDLALGLPHLEKIIIVGKAQEGEIEFWSALKASSSEFQYLRTKAEDPVILIYTSGTTGPPKGALHAHRVMIGNYPGFEMSHNFFPREVESIVYVLQILFRIAHISLVHMVLHLEKYRSRS